MASITQPTTSAIQAQPQTRAQTGTSNRRRFDGFRGFAYLLLTFMVIVYVLPLIWMLFKSVMSFGEANSPAFLPSEIHLENYAYVLTDPNVNFLRALGSTLILEILTVGGQTVFSLMAAYGFSRIRFPGRDLLFSLFLLTIFIPASVTLVPRLIIVTNISRAMASINPALGWLNSWQGLVIPFLASTFSIFLLRQFFRQVPEDLWDAARIDGAGHLRYLFAILVPVSRAAVVTTILINFIGTWTALEWPLLIATDKNGWRPIGVALYQLSSDEHAAQTHLLMAGSVLALLPILLLYFVAQKQLIEGIATTGLKG